MHGHDLACLAYIPSMSCYVSGAEEKVLRVFQAPQAFSQTLAMAHGQSSANLQSPATQVCISVDACKQLPSSICCSNHAATAYILVWLRLTRAEVNSSAADQAAPGLDGFAFHGCRTESLVSASLTCLSGSLCKPCSLSNVSCLMIAQGIQATGMRAHSRHT